MISFRKAIFALPLSFALPYVFIYFKYITFFKFLLDFYKVKAFKKDSRYCSLPIKTNFNDSCLHIVEAA